LKVEKWRGLKNLGGNWKIEIRNSKFENRSSPTLRSRKVIRDAPVETTPAPGILLDSRREPNSRPGCKKRINTRCVEGWATLRAILREAGIEVQSFLKA
jgi:hypothetical protein